MLEGFDSIAGGNNKINITRKLYADWTEKGAYNVVDSMLSAAPPRFSCLFAHNDRMAVGARKACQKHGIDISKIRFCGIDAMPEEGGGMQLISEGKLFASYTYPTRGDEVMQLAMNILTGKKYERENLLASALVTHENASVLLMQYDETVRQQSRLATLRSSGQGCKRLPDSESVPYNTCQLPHIADCGMCPCRQRIPHKGSHKPKTEGGCKASGATYQGDRGHDAAPTAVLHQRQP